MCLQRTLRCGIIGLILQLFRCCWPCSSFTSDWHAIGYQRIGMLIAGLELTFSIKGRRMSASRMRQCRKQFRYMHDPHMTSRDSEKSACDACEGAAVVKVMGTLIRTVVPFPGCVET